MSLNALSNDSPAIKQSVIIDVIKNKSKNVGHESNNTLSSKSQSKSIDSSELDYKYPVLGDVGGKVIVSFEVINYIIYNVCFFNIIEK